MTSKELQKHSLYFFNALFKHFIRYFSSIFVRISHIDTATDWKIFAIFRHGGKRLRSIGKTLFHEKRRYVQSIKKFLFLKRKKERGKITREKGVLLHHCAKGIEDV